jgi:hypothetical protein
MLLTCALFAASLLPACSDDAGSGDPSTAGAGPAAGTSGMSGSSGSGSAGASGAAAGGSASGTAGASSGGAGGSAGSTSGGSGGSPPGPVKPVMRDGKWALDLGDVTLEVDPTVGARIVSFKLGAENLLTGATVNPTYYGSTLWISPEAEWQHAPHINAMPYMAQATDTAVALTIAADQSQGVGATKTFSVDPARGSFVIEYKLTNGKQTEIQAAPWEVTRVFARGLTFFPSATTPTTSPGATMPTTNAGGVIWYEYDQAVVTQDSKLYADGTEGWVAHVAAGLVFIKVFADVTADKIAPNEGDVELYTNADHTYIELENQAAYGPIAAGQSVTWKVEWFLRRLPAALQATAGNMALTQFVRETIAK